MLRFVALWLKKEKCNYDVANKHRLYSLQQERVDNLKEQKTSNSESCSLVLSSDNSQIFSCICWQQGRYVTTVTELWEV